MNIYIYMFVYASVIVIQYMEFISRKVLTSRFYVSWIQTDFFWKGGLACDIFFF